MRVSKILTIFCDIAVMPKKVDPIAQRQMIANAAIRVIDRDGIEGAKLRDIARAANVTTGTIMHYFENKQQVLEAVLEMIVARTIERMQRCNVPAGTVPITKFINDAIHQLPINEENRAEWRVWLAFCGAAVADRHLLNIHRRHYRKLVSRVMLLLHRLHAGNSEPGPFEDREPQRFALRDAQIAVLAVPENRQSASAGQTHLSASGASLRRGGDRRHRRHRYARYARSRSLAFVVPGRGAG